MAGLSGEKGIYDMCTIKPDVSLEMAPSDLLGHCVLLKQSRQIHTQKKTYNIAPLMVQNRVPKRAPLWC